MAWQKKSTGIAANLLTCIAVDPDTDQIKDFASSAVTADMTISGGITVGSQSWDGNTRKYFLLASGQYVAFGTNKPQFVYNTGSTRTYVWIGELSSGGSDLSTVCGADASNYFGEANNASGNDHPYIQLNGGNASGGFSRPAASAKVVFGHSLAYGAASSAYTALHNAGSMSRTNYTPGGTPSNYAISYVGRRNDSSAQVADKIHAVLIFDRLLTEAEWDSLRDDWLNVLLEVAGGGAAALEAAAAATAIASGALNATAHALAADAIAHAQAAAALTTDSAGKVAITEWRNNTGTLLASLTGLTVDIHLASTGALVVRLTGQATDAGGDWSYQNLNIDIGTLYKITPFDPTTVALDPDLQKAGVMFVEGVAP